MKLGIIGAGNIGGTLGRKWAGANHEVVFGVRDPQKASLVQQIGEMGGGARAALSADAIAAGDVIVFAVPGAAVAAVVDANADALAGKIIIDASNNMRGESRHALQLLREKAPSARLFRAFNSLGWENLADPDFDGVRADLFFCGDEDLAELIFCTCQCNSLKQGLFHLCFVVRRSLHDIPAHLRCGFDICILDFSHALSSLPC